MRFRLSNLQWIFISAILFTLFVILASLLMFLAPYILKELVKKKMWLGYDSDGHLSENTRTWIDPKYIMYFQVHIFSVKNAQMINKDHKVVPLFEEKGPYSFREIQHKNATFSNDGTKVMYRSNKSFQFDQQTSCKDCFLTDRVSVPNLALQAVWRKIKNSIIVHLISEIVDKNNITTFETVEVGQLLFEGYEDPLLVAIKKEYPDQYKNETTRIQLFRDKNETYSEPYEINTGLKNNEDIGKLYSWNSSTITNAWYKPDARIVKGHDGQLFPIQPESDPINSFELFIGDICRAVKFELNKKTFYDDLPALEYHVSDSMHDVDKQRQIGYCNPNSTQFFENREVQADYCAPKGLLDISSCKANSDGIFIGEPHFHNSHPLLREMSIGVRKWSSDETTKILIDPSTGVVVNAQQFTQINLGVLDGQLNPLKGLLPRIVPLVWINETIIYDSAAKSSLHSLYHIKLAIYWAAIALYMVSLVLFFILIILLCRQVLQNNTRKSKIVSITPPIYVIPKLRFRQSI